MSLLTIFTAPKPFTQPHIAVIQRNAIRSWMAMSPDVKVVLLGDEEGIAETARLTGACHLPDVRRNPLGTPLISSMFELARSHSDSPLLAIVNTDMILRRDVLKASINLMEQRRTFLMVSRRWDLGITHDLDFSPGWEEHLSVLVEQEGRLHPPHGSDIFVFPRTCYERIPDFAIGRAGWDNWMIYEARQRGWGVVDATHDLKIIHQDHDYSHLPGGQPHYKLPETFENVRLAGGARTILGITDSNLLLESGKVRPARLDWKKFWREVELFPLVSLHNYPLAQVFYALFHPVKAYRDFRKWLREYQK